jgi:multidrug efflux pump subunit AcrA (membrane-fusion protein)
VRILMTGKCRWTATLGCAAVLAAGGLLGGCREKSTAAAQAPAGAPAAKAGNAAAATSSAPTAASTPTRPTVTVRRETLRRFAPAPGSFRARQTTRLGPQVSGRVQEVLVEVGDVVRQGQVLVRLDPTFFALEAEQSVASANAAKGALASAKVDTADAQREMKRQLGLFEGGTGSTKERDDAVTRYDRAVADEAEKLGRANEADKKLEWAQKRL